MWWEQQPLGKRVHRTAVIGTAEQYPGEELAREAVRGLRMQIMEARNVSPNKRAIYFLVIMWPTG